MLTFILQSLQFLIEETLLAALNQSVESGTYPPLIANLDQDVFELLHGLSPRKEPERYVRPESWNHEVQRSR